MGEYTYDLQAERAVLGACFYPDVIDEVSEILSPKMFWRPQHEKIFATMQRLSAEESPVDLVTMEEALKRNGWLDEVGRPYLVDLKFEAVATAANASYHAKIVFDYFRLREIEAVGRELASLSKDSSSEVDEILEKAQSRLHLAANPGKNARPLYEFFDGVIERMEKGVIRDYFTDYPDIDERCRLRRGHLIFVAGETNIGKTTFALDLAHKFCLRKSAVLYLSLEMNEDELAERYLCRLASVPYARFSEGRLTQSQKERLARTYSGLQHDSAYPAILRAEARKLPMLKTHARNFFRKSNGQFGVLFVDYLGLLAPAEKKENRNQEMAHLARELKNMAEELQILVVCLAQLSRLVAGRKDRKPELSDLRDSGEIEQAADGVWFLWRNPNQIGKADGGGNYLNEEAELLIRKQRHGRIGDVPLLFFGEEVGFRPRLRTE